MARKNGGACANPKQIRGDVDCRAAQPRFDNGAWSPAKISDVTGDGLDLFVTPDESGPGNAASRLSFDIPPASLLNPMHRDR